MGATSAQITSLAIVYSTVYSDADQRRYESYASLAFVCGIHRWQTVSNAENVSIWWRRYWKSREILGLGQGKWVLMKYQR